MKQNIFRIFRPLIVVVLLSGSLFALATFSGPTALPPGNNDDGPLNSGSTPQSKGGSVVPAGSLLDINGTTATEYLFAWKDITVANNLTVGSLAAPSGYTGGPLRTVCTQNVPGGTQPRNKLVACVPICGDSVIQTEIGEQCDDGNTNNSDSCTNTCQNYVATSSQHTATVIGNSGTITSIMSSVDGSLLTRPLYANQTQNFTATNAQANLDIDINFAPGPTVYCVEIDDSAGNHFMEYSHGADVYTFPGVQLYGSSPTPTTIRLDSDSGSVINCN